uniref:Uncharacterized protein n=1 Tax=Anguilla anguilla TaxID=7936 RepID=A0A0E9T1J2_ANGAN
MLMLQYTIMCFD